MLKENDLPEEILIFIKKIFKKDHIEDFFDLPEFKALSEENKSLLITLLEEYLTKHNSESITNLSDIENSLQLFTKTCFRLVPDMLALNKIDFAIFLACISSILSDIWDDKIDMKSLASGMHHLMIMHVNPDNKKAQKASNMFNNFQSINN